MEIMRELKGKRLLLLGGQNIVTGEVAKIARQMGVYVIAADYLEICKSPAKRYADEAVQISTTDTEQLKKLIREKNIDGIFTGSSEAAIPLAMNLCQEMGMPFYCTKEQWDICSDKRTFKDLCVQYDVPVVKEYRLTEPLSEEDLTQIEYPVIVKPVDGSGSVGISQCGNRDEFNEGLRKALDCSKSKQVIVEKYMTGDEVVIYYTVQDGQISFSAMCDRYTNHEQAGVAQLPTAYVFKSKYIEKYMEETNEKVIRMYESLGLKNGVIFIQSFIEDGSVRFYEMGYRLCGAQEFRIVRAVNEMDTVKMMIAYALTGKMMGWDAKSANKPNFDKYACKLSPLAWPCTIGSIEGLEEIAAMSCVTDVVPNYVPGDVIAKAGTLQQIVVRIFLVEDTPEKLADAIDAIQNTLRVKDSEGHDVLMESFDTDIIRTNY